MAIEDNKAIVKHYMEALDTGNMELLELLLSNNYQMYRPEQPEPLIGIEAAR